MMGYDIDVDRVQKLFKEYLVEKGFCFDGLPVMDGVRHRVPVEGDVGEKKSGYYIGYLDGWPNGWGCNFRLGMGSLLDKWKYSVDCGYKGGYVSGFSRERNRVKKGVEEDLVKKRERAKDLLSYLCRTLSKASNDHKYLVRKGVVAENYILFNPRFGSLFLPVLDFEGEVISAQWIAENSLKGFMRSLPVKGGFNIVGGGGYSGFSFSGSESIYIAEGYATAKSVSLGLDDSPVFNVYSVNNIASFLSGLVDKCGGLESDVVLFLDNDVGKEVDVVSVVYDLLREQFEDINFKLVLPCFEGERGGDWNDYHQLYGVDSLMGELESRLVVGFQNVY